MGTAAGMPALTPGTSAQAGSDWELARQWSIAWRALKWGITAIIALGFLTVIGQGYLFYQIFADIHPILGWVFIAALTTLLALLVGRPLVSFFRTPVMATPPDITLDPANPDRQDLARRVAYDLRYLRALKRNPNLAGESQSLTEGLDTGRKMLARCRAGDGDPKHLLADIYAFERRFIDAKLAALDTKVDQLIRTEAVAVGVATAVSMNGTVDAFIVLWRNANLVSKIARLYFGRPHLRGSLLIMRDVAAIVLVSRALEDVTDITGDVIGGLLGRMGGLVAGPVMDGAVNATMTLKLGYLAKRRCRSFRAWSPAEAKSISAEALERVKRDSTSVVTDLVKRCGGLTASAARATEAAMQGSKSTWTIIQSWFGAPAR